MRERLGASEAEVERADDESPVAGTSLKNKSKKQQEGRTGNDDENEDDSDDAEGMGEDSGSDSDGGADAAGTGRKVSKLRKASPGKGGGGDKRKHGAAAVVTEDITVPDMVEDLGAWSDNEWA